MKDSLKSCAFISSSQIFKVQERGCTENKIRGKFRLKGFLFYPVWVFGEDYVAPVSTDNGIMMQLASWAFFSPTVSGKMNLGFANLPWGQ